MDEPRDYSEAALPHQFGGGPGGEPVGCGLGFTVQRVIMPAVMWSPTWQ